MSRFETTRKASRRAQRLTHEFRTDVGLRLLEWRSRRIPAGSVVRVGDFRVRINDGRNFYVLYKDIFVRRLYDLHPAGDAPRIVDCGSNIGIPVLYFKQRFPRARITCFEPDPGVLPYLQENLARNGFDDVEIRAEAVADRAGTLAFYAGSDYASALAEFGPGEDPPPGLRRIDVPCIRLRDALDEPVDFLKLNIEGAETRAIVDAADRISAVQELVVEYHHLPGLARSLHTLLAALHDAGFEYLVHSFDEHTSPGAQPPFELDSSSTYFLLVYARRKAKSYQSVVG